MRKTEKFNYKNAIEKAQNQFGIVINSIVLIEAGAKNTISFSKYIAGKGRVWSCNESNYKAKAKIGSAGADIVCFQTKGMTAARRSGVLVAQLSNEAALNEIINLFKNEYNYGK